VDKKLKEESKTMKRMNTNRRNFIKKSAAGLAGVAFLPSFIKGEEESKAEESKKKRKIIYRTLGKTGIKLPIISVGAVENKQLLAAALDVGVVYLDTASNYMRGRHEEIVAEVVKGRPRDSYVIGTKVYVLTDQKTGLIKKGATAASFIETFEASLKRLGLDYVEFLHLHAAIKKEAVFHEAILSAMQKMKKEGKARFLGVSVHTNEPEVIRAAVDTKVHDVVLTAYNFRQPHVAEVEKAIDYAAKAGLGIVAMKTQAGVYWDKERKHPINPKAALKWVLQNENVHTTIPGFTTFDQMETDLSVMEDLTLTPQEKADLKIGEKLALTGLYCSQCRQCLSQCPKKLDIPTLMRSYMYAYGYRNLAKARETMEGIDLSSPACNDCTTCSVKCTMGFDVRDKIKDISRIKDIPQEFLV
jgi:predicted aldo/keto reductase-like oxidoreductase